MTRTCTVQVNLDFASEADMVKKFRVSLALQPIATALFADSPFTEGKPNGFLSYRSHIWTDTDPDRTGMLDFVFEDGFGFERYVDYLLDVPMYFVYRDGEYIDCQRPVVPRFPGRQARRRCPARCRRCKDWADHMTTAFPEVRLKKYLEMRGADGGPWNRLCALPAFWVGLLYDDARSMRPGTWSRTSSLEERNALRDGVPRQALKLPFRNGTVRDLRARALKISAARPAAPRAPQPQRRRRVDLPRAADRVRRGRQHPGRAQAGAVPRPVGRHVDPVFPEFAY